MNNDPILLDPNIVIYTSNADPGISDFIDDKKGVISFVTEIEPLDWKGITSQNRPAIKLFLSDCIYIEYNLRIKQATIDFKSKYSLKLAGGLLLQARFNSIFLLYRQIKYFQRSKK